MNDARLHRMRFGAQPLGPPGSGTRFALWAPGCEHVRLEIVDAAGALRDTREMPRRDGGWFELACKDLSAGTRYRYRVRDDLAVPDPASRWNPQDVHGPSEVVDPRSFDWQHPGWTGRPWRSAVLYELHVGTWTPEGRYASAAARLPHLRDLGITAVELMPLADFPGTRNWGYDGVLAYAPDASYGTPDELRRFVDTAHGLGLMVLLDVVYNHFGPDGNYLGTYAPAFFNPQRHTPWGAAINVDAAHSETVRQFFVDNAMYWVTEFGFDGLRLDAVHAIEDHSDLHLVEQIAAALRDGPGRTRKVHLVLENDDNRARWLQRTGHGTPAIATAQWNDDLHHAAHVLATGEREGYYRDYLAMAEAPSPLDAFGRALAEGYVYQGQASAHRGGARRGEPSADLPALAFVAFLQNHDQVGNRAFGERLDALADASRVEALLACLLLAPQVPMLFMGEEYAARTPFLYFCDAHGELADAIREGRRREFASFQAFADPARRAAIPDPNARATFEASRLNWQERESPRGRERLAHVRALLAVRHRELEPWLEGQRGPGRRRVVGDVLEVRWPFAAAAGGITWTLRVRLEATAEAEAEVEVQADPGEQVVYALRATRRAHRPAGEAAVAVAVAVVLQRDAVEVSIVR